MMATTELDHCVCSYALATPLSHNSSTSTDSVARRVGALQQNRNPHKYVNVLKTPVSSKDMPQVSSSTEQHVRLENENTTPVTPVISVRSNSPVLPTSASLVDSSPNPSPESSVNSRTLLIKENSADLEKAKEKFRGDNISESRRKTKRYTSDLNSRLENILCKIKPLLYIAMIISLILVIFYLLVEYKQIRLQGELETQVFQSQNLSVISGHLYTAHTLQNPEVELNITVYSYEDYLRKFQNISINRATFLTISIANSYDWPENFSIKNPVHITKLKLEGNISFYMMSQLILEMKQAGHLILSNKQDKMCQTNTKIHDKIKYKLNHVKSLVLQGFTECGNMYKAISKNLALKHLENFVMEEGVINSENKKCIQRILINSKSTLKSVQFPMTFWETSLFDRNIDTLPSVDFLRVDLVNPSLEYFNVEISNILPKLKEFVSREGILSWKEFVYMSGCKQINYFSSALQVEPNKNAFDLSILLSFYPEIRQLDLVLVFPTTNHHLAECRIEDVNGFERKLEKCSIKSICPSSASSNYSSKDDYVSAQMKIIRSMQI